MSAYFQIHLQRRAAATPGAKFNPSLSLRFCCFFDLLAKMHQITLVNDIYTQRSAVRSRIKITFLEGKPMHYRG